MTQEHIQNRSNYTGSNSRHRVIARGASNQVAKQRSLPDIRTHPHSGLASRFLSSSPYFLILKKLH